MSTLRSLHPLSSVYALIDNIEGSKPNGQTFALCGLHSTPYLFNALFVSRPEPPINSSASTPQRLLRSWHQVGGTSRCGAQPRSDCHSLVSGAARVDCCTIYGRENCCGSGGRMEIAAGFRTIRPNELECQCKDGERWTLSARSSGAWLRSRAGDLHNSWGRAGEPRFCCGGH